MRPSLRVLLVVHFAAAGLLSGGPVVGDWLVRTDGFAVETRGGLAVKGRLVVFHTPDGKFASMRLDEVDLEASEARTEAAKAAAKAGAERLPEKPMPAPKAKFVLTDADVGHVDPDTMPNPAISPVEAETASTSESAVERGEGESVTPEDNPLEVVSWDAVLGADSDGVLISGQVRNPSELFASDISILVTVFDLEGGEIDARAASMKANALGPGEQGPFQVSFPGVFNIGKALFEVTSFNAVVSK